ncbi:Cullin, N-terminal [Kalmanozyma brasiliensis GHG001]|uniref:Cullin family profile domain-containing protein n=1 Tax=Kalmanozyma brasiliensis (strain GHG001) TaxID=1365824 RepID=V5ERJ2_KALBG|nr:Cullin, N-terminal [Kalmanozyma brasiliensis GHG001]EST04494.1 Cullin, N-terminal [Kalmanozyma brasiliensis GHG001]
MNAPGSMRRPGGTRGTKLKPPKKIGLDVSIEDMWLRLVHAISQIQNHNISKLSYEEHYRYAYNLVLYQQGDMLYHGVKKQVQQHLDKLCREKIIPAFPPGGAASVSAGIILPDSLLSQSQAAASSSSSRTEADTPIGARSSSGSNKGKGKATADDHDSFADGPDGATSAATAAASMSATQAGDRADAVARIQAGERLMTAIRDTWLDHRSCMSKLSEVLKYVDRVYVENQKVPSINRLGLEIFRDSVIRSTKYPIQIYLYSTLLTHIQIEREGSAISRSLLKSNVDMLADLTQNKPSASINHDTSVYSSDFEPAFLQTSAAFYSAEADRWLDAGDAAKYLAHVARRLQEEADRVSVYLKPETHKPLQHLLEKNFLANHLATILNMPGSGLVSMLDDNRKEDLGRLYTLFNKVSGGPQTLRLGLKSYIATKGKLINDAVTSQTAQQAPSTDGPAEDASSSKGKTREKPNADADASTPQAATAIRWVEDVLEFKNKFDSILDLAFAKDTGCETAINEAFESFINTNKRAPEFISLFIDENLKKGLKGKTEAEVEDILRKTISVFRFLHEKDTFERYYKQHLAKRLLQGRSVSDDAERGMMAKLKIESGHGYVAKLQGMLNDMKTSEETTDEFARVVKNSHRPMPFALSVNVLTSTNWPISAQAPSCVMSDTLMEARRRFEEFYQSKHNGRVLTWHANMGSADVRVAFRARTHEINLSTFALVVLLLFDSDEESEQTLSYADIARATQIPDHDLQRTLQSLACAKFRILTKTPKSRDVSPTDTFVFNTTFTCPLARFKIQQIAARVETAKERKATNEKVEEERAFLVEACIVRIMKNRKQLSHNELVQETITQLTSRFQPNLGMIKKRIESLIEREYLERAEGGRGMYNYLA